MIIKANKLVRYGQGIIGLKDTDILLASFPKSGNTWVRFFLCNLISLYEWNGKKVDFVTLDTTMPELGVSNLMRPWPHTTIPRIVKTHQKFWPIFNGKSAIFIMRDPRDVMVSFYHFEAAMKCPQFVGNFSDFIRHKKLGLEAWFNHYKSWRGRVKVTLSYEDLRKDDIGEFTRMLCALDIPVDKKVIKHTAINSRFEKIRSLKKTNENPVFKEGFNFARKGKSGTWKEYFDESDTAYYLDLKEKYALEGYGEA
jgi:hypothetical protein